jgi:hypothetical protein
MYSHTLLIDARIDALRRARGTSTQPQRDREDRGRRGNERHLLRRAGIRALELAGAPGAAWTPRS